MFFVLIVGNPVGVFILYLCVGLVEQLQQCVHSVTQSAAGVQSRFFSSRTDPSV